MPKTFYITTAIDYTNSPPHIGHTYEKVLADVIARYHRLKRRAGVASLVWTAVILAGLLWTGLSVSLGAAAEGWSRQHG